MFRVNLDSMVAAHQLHQGSNLRGHLVWARYQHFQRLLSIRNVPVESEDEEILQFFRDTNDPDLYMERNAMSRSEFRKLVSPLSGVATNTRLQRRVQNRGTFTKNRLVGNQAQLPKKIS